MGGVDRVAAEEWIRGHVSPLAIEAASVEPWATVLRVRTADGTVWLKACEPVQEFEPQLTVQLYERWPNLVAEVIAHDGGRRWLLLADAGTRIGDRGNPPELWDRVLPRYAELQRGEVAHAQDHLAHGVPDLRAHTLADHYDELLWQDLPITADEVEQLRQFAPRFEELCVDLATQDIPASIQHDDLHMNNVYEAGGALRIIDWGDSSIAHPFFSLFVTFRFLEERNKLPPHDRWFARLRDSYLEPWGPGLVETFELAMRVGAFAHAMASVRIRHTLSDEARVDFDDDFAVILRRALALSRL